MPSTLQEIQEKTRDLSDNDKLALVDSLLEQLDRPDPELDRAWTEEALKRRQAYRKGRLEARDYEEVMKSLRRS